MWSQLEHINFNKPIWVIVLRSVQLCLIYSFNALLCFNKFYHAHVLRWRLLCAFAIVKSIFMTFHFGQAWLGTLRMIDKFCPPFVQPPERRRWWSINFHSNYSWFGIGFPLWPLVGWMFPAFDHLELFEYVFYHETWNVEWSSIFLNTISLQRRFFSRFWKIFNNLFLKCIIKGKKLNFFEKR